MSHCTLLNETVRGLLLPIYFFVILPFFGQVCSAYGPLDNTGTIQSDGVLIASSGRDLVINGSFDGRGGTRYRI